MELSNNKAVIISAGIGHWYAQGVRRLERTLNFEGWGGSILTWKDEYPPNSYAHDYLPYYFKISAFEEAIRQGFTHILWCDASMWCVKHPMPIFDIINEQGYYFFSSGYNLAQTANDRALEVAGIGRDDAEKSTEWASGLVGMNLNNPDGSNLYRTWKEYMDLGLSQGSRYSNKDESKDPRFIHHRQDQTCLSMAAHKHGLVNKRGLDMVAYKGGGYNENKLIFFIEGL